MKHAYVRNGEVIATRPKAILAAIVEDGGARLDAAWFGRTGTAEKKAVGVYEVIDQRPAVLLKFVRAVPLALVFDAQADQVIQPYAQQEMQVDEARARLKQRITNKHRRRIANGQVSLAGMTLSTHNDAYNELEKAVARATSAPFSAVTRAGDLVRFTQTRAQNALAAVDTYRDACVDREAALYAMADGAANVAALRDIDIEAGWP